jgi:hypothetical protein
MSAPQGNRLSSIKGTRRNWFCRENKRAMCAVCHRCVTKDDFVRRYLSHALDPNKYVTPRV